MKKSRGILWMMAVLAALGIGGMALYRTRVQAQIVFDETTAVRYADYAAEHVIESGMLFIGTHLIHVQGMTEELYEMALKSAETSMQQEVFYKSELSDGAWYNITDAGGLADISVEGMPVEEAELADLWVTHYTGSDGNTVDVKTGAKVCIFDAPDPYDLYNLPELEPLRIQYDNLIEMDENTDSDGYYREQLAAFFQKDLRNEMTAVYDGQLTALQRIYETLRAEGADNEAEIVYQLMGKADSARRAEIFYQLTEQEDCELNRLQETFSGNGEAEVPDELIVNFQLISALGDAIQNCQERYTTHSGNRLVSGDTVLKDAEYDYSLSVMAQSSGGITETLRNDLRILQWIMNLEENVVGDAAAELQLLEERLLPAADEKFAIAVRALPSDAYKSAVQNQVSLAARNQILEDQKADADSVRTELQYLIEAKTKRQDAQEGVNFVYERIDWADAYYGMIADSDFKEKATETITEHIRWLQELAERIVNTEESLTSEMDRLKEEKEALKVQQGMALDDNDLSGAAWYAAMIEAVDEAISREEKRLSDILDSDDAGAVEKVMAGIDLGSDSLRGSIENIKNRALEKIRNGDSDSIEYSVEGLAALGAEDALQEIHSLLEASGESGKMLRAVEAAIEESSASSLYAGSGDSGGSGGSTGSGNGGGSGGSESGDSGGIDLQENALADLISDVTGIESDALSGTDLAAAIAALGRLGADGNRAAQEFAADLAYKLLAESGNGLYLQYEDSKTVEYVSLRTLAAYSGFRYIYSDTQRSATLAKGARAYKFQVGSAVITFFDGSIKALKTEVVFQGSPYVETAVAEDYFGCRAEYIPGTIFGVCMDAGTAEAADKLYDAFTRGEK